MWLMSCVWQQVTVFGFEVIATTGALLQDVLGALRCIERARGQLYGVEKTCYWGRAQRGNGRDDGVSLKDPSAS